MPVEWDYVRGPLPLVRTKLLDLLDRYALHKRALRIGISTNPLLSFIEHAEDRGLGSDQYLGERLVCIYETTSLDEAVLARELLLSHARLTLPAVAVARDERSGLPEKDPDLPFFVYLLGDSVCVFPVETLPQG